MTKTKRQLRAEAVERLKNSVGARFKPDAAVIAIVGGRIGLADWSFECDKLIDLLTDDELPDDGVKRSMTNLDWLMENEPGFKSIVCDLALWMDFAPTGIDELTSDWLMSERSNDASAPESSVSDSEPSLTPESCRQHVGKAKQPADADCESCDSREKLEADMRMLLGWVADSAVAWGDADAAVRSFIADAIRMLDRQAAITSAEWERATDVLKAERDELKRRVSQLDGDLEGARTSRDRWRDVATKHVAEIQRLKRKLKDAEKYGTIWPRFEDGAIVKFGDEIEWSDNGEPKAAKVSEIKFERYFSSEVRSGIRVNAFTHTTRAIGEPYKRPPLKAKDGQPIEEGTLLYGEDGRAWLVESIDHADKYPIEGSCDGEFKRLKAEWLTHEKPDSWERIVSELRGYPQCFEMSHDAITTLADRIEKLAKGAMS